MDLRIIIIFFVIKQYLRFLYLQATCYSAKIINFLKPNHLRCYALVKTLTRIILFLS